MADELELETDSEQSSHGESNSKAEAESSIARRRLQLCRRRVDSRSERDIETCSAGTLQWVLKHT